MRYISSRVLNNKEQIMKECNKTCLCVDHDGTILQKCDSFASCPDAVHGFDESVGMGIFFIMLFGLVVIPFTIIPLIYRYFQAQ